MKTETITFDMKWEPFVRPLVDVAKGADNPEARENAICELEGMARAADLAGEMLHVLREIQLLTKRAAHPSDTKNGWEPVAVDRLMEISKKAKRTINKVKE